MKNKILKYSGLIMVIIAIIFILIAFKHPEFAWPWSNTVTYVIYGLYLIIMSIMFIIGGIVRDKDKKEKIEKKKGQKIKNK